MRARALSHSAAAVAAAIIAAATLGGIAAATGSVTATSVTMSAAPPSPQQVDTPVLVEVALAPAAAVGTVKLYDGSTLLAKADHYSSLWSYSTSALAIGSHELTVTFTPTDPTYSPSTGVLTYVITGEPVTPTTTTLSVSPSSHLQAGQRATFTADVAPAAAAGTVQFAAGSDVLGSSAVKSGVASMSSRELAVGADDIAASFTASTSSYAGSVSEPLQVDVAAKAVVTPAPTPTPSVMPKPTASATPSPTHDHSATPRSTPTPTRSATTTAPSSAVKGEHSRRHGTSGNSGPLPFTGLNATDQLLVAAALLLAGAGLLFTVRHRGQRRPTQ